MREEINEPQHWRRSRRVRPSVKASWSMHRHANSPLPAEAVDAAFEEDSKCFEQTHGAHYNAKLPESLRAGVQPAATPVEAVQRNGEPASEVNLVQGLSSQLAMLDAQRAQLQYLLEQARDSQI